MLQADEPDDFVIATGETHTVREFLEVAFAHAGLDWEPYVEIDPRYFRPAEVDELLGDAEQGPRAARLGAEGQVRRAGADHGRRRRRGARGPARRQGHALQPRGVSVRGLRARSLNLPLIAIVVVATAFVAYYTRKVTEWSVMTDELLYVKLALNIGDTGSPFPALHGEGFAVFSQLYPLLTAPIYQLFDMPTAFRAVHLLNALIMGSAAIPAYLLAREVVAQRAAAYLVAATTVAVPWMTMATMVLTEVAAYPAFIWAVLALQRTMVRPSRNHDLVALGGVALAFLGRTQFILLAPILVVAIVVHEAAFEAVGPSRVPVLEAVRIGLRRFWNEHRVLAIASIAAVIVAIPALSGRAVQGVGNYQRDRSGALA